VAYVYVPVFGAFALLIACYDPSFYVCIIPGVTICLSSLFKLTNDLAYAGYDNTSSYRRNELEAIYGAALIMISQLAGLACSCHSIKQYSDTYAVVSNNERREDESSQENESLVQDSGINNNDEDDM